MFSRGVTIREAKNAWANGKLIYIASLGRRIGDWNDLANTLEDIGWRLDQLQVVEKGTGSEAFAVFRR